ncbi:MAG: PPOX class probable F420-dependent enzyme, partial [Actinomycetes bacterium]
MTTLDSLSAGKYISITTFRKSGEGVSTPLWVTRDGEALYVITGAESGKVKRMRNN